MRGPCLFLLVLAAIVAAYVWMFVWTDDVTQRTPNRPASVAGDAVPAKPG